MEHVLSRLDMIRKPKECPATQITFNDCSLPFEILKFPCHDTRGNASSLATSI